MDSSHEVVSWSGQNREGAYPLTRDWVLPILPQAGDPKWGAIFHRDRVRLFAVFGRLPFVEAINREDTSAHPIGFPERGQTRHRFGLGIGRLSTALWIRAPVWDETPTQHVKRPLAAFVILPDHQKFLARRAVPTPRMI